MGFFEICLIIKNILLGIFRYYKSHLAKRLLLQKSVSDDAEKAMVARLKVIMIVFAVILHSKQIRFSGHLVVTSPDFLFIDIRLENVSSTLRSFFRLNAVVSSRQNSRGCLKIWKSPIL